MALGTGRRALPFLYLVPVTAVCAFLAVCGYLLDRLPLLPASVSLRYQGFMFATIVGLCRLVDGWTDRPAEPVAGSVAGESAP